MSIYTEIDSNTLNTLRRAFLSAVENGLKVKSHGLGAAQIIIPSIIIDGFEINQFHVWDKRLCVFPEEQTGHSHRFDMLSFVLYGYIDNVDVSIKEGTDYKIGTHLDHGDDFELERFVSIETNKFRVESGNKYYMRRDEFHQFDVPDVALTFVCKKNVSGYSSVLFPADVPFKSGCSEDMREYLLKNGTVVVNEMYDRIKNSF